MKFILSFCFLVLLSSNGLLAQTPFQDSIEANRLLQVQNIPEENVAATKQILSAAALFKKHKMEVPYYQAMIKSKEKKTYEIMKTMLDEGLALNEEIEKTFGNNHILNVEAQVLVGHNYYRAGQQTKAIEAFKKAEALLEKMPKAPKATKAKLLMQLGAAYFQNNDRKRALDYMLVAKDITEKIKGEEFLLTKILEHLARLQFDQIKGIKAISNAITISEKEFHPNHAEVCSLLLTKAFVYYQRQESANASEVLIDLASRQEKRADNKTISVELATTYGLLGVIYKDWIVPGNITDEEQRAKIKNEKVERAAIYLLKSVDVYNKWDYKYSLNTSQVYRNLGFLYQERLGDDYKALSCFHKALLALLPEVVESDSTASIDIVGNNYIYLEAVPAVYAMQGKALALRNIYNSTKDESLLKKSLEVLAQMDLLMDHHTATIADDGLGDIWHYRSQMITTLGLPLNELIYNKSKDIKYLNSAFVLIEKNKNIQLLSSIKSDKEAKLGNVDSLFLVQEKEIKKSIAEVRKKMLDKNKNESREKLQEKLLSLRVEYYDLLKKIEKENPDYHQIKYKNEIPNLEKVQKELDDETMIVEYQVFKWQWYALFITKDSTWLLPCIRSEEETQRDMSMHEPITKLRKWLENPQKLNQTPKEAFAELNTNAHSLYKILRLDHISKYPKIKKLIIVPSEQLNHIPFELLLCTTSSESQTQNYNDLDYLIKHFQISYANSASLWMQNMTVPSNDHGTMVGFAASYGKDSLFLQNAKRSNDLKELRGQLIPLPGARAELATLENRYAGTFYFDEMANEKVFKTNTKGHSIVHLAMHGLLNKKHSFASSLAFTENGDKQEDNFVYAYEITQMAIESDLVVLSACETGYGKFNYGEGVASLARSFMYAGTPSLVMSLWQVNDYSTSKIMTFFYEGLEEGLSKPAALQAAKLKYIELAEGSAAHPFFWAPFVQLGNTKPVVLHTKKSILYRRLGMGGIGIILVASLFFVIKRRKKERNNEQSFLINIKTL